MAVFVVDGLAVEADPVTVNVAVYGLKMFLKGRYDLDKKDHTDLKIRHLQTMKISGTHEPAKQVAITKLLEELQGVA